MITNILDSSISVHNNCCDCRAIFWDMVFFLILGQLMNLAGLVLYSYFNKVEKCDPIRSGAIGSPNHVGIHTANYKTRIYSQSNVYRSIITINIIETKGPFVSGLARIKRSCLLGHRMGYCHLTTLARLHWKR